MQSIGIEIVSWGITRDAACIVLRHTWKLDQLDHEAMLRDISGLAALRETAILDRLFGTGLDRSDKQLSSARLSGIR